MLKGYKYRLAPTKEQIQLLNQHVGAARFVYNLALDCKQQAYTRAGKTLSCFDLTNQLPDLKEACPWLKDVNSQSLQMALRNLDNAFTNFFKGRADYPKYRKKTNGGSFQVPANGHVLFGKGLITLPKFKSGIKAVLHRPFMGTVKTVTIQKTPTGKFFASVLVETPEEPTPLVPLVGEKVVGIDLGIKDFLVTNEGQKVANPKYLRTHLHRLKTLQRRATKKVKGSNNRKKAYQKVAKAHEKIANLRKDFLHKLSANLVKNHDGIAIEDLAVKNLVKNHKLAQAISDVSWSEFRRQLTYKCAWAGKHLLVIGRFQPSTKLCSCCGVINRTLTLKDREWTCPGCGSKHDRDVNAAINIKKMALVKYKISPAERGAVPVEPTGGDTSLLGVMKQEKFSACAEKPLCL